MRTSKEQIVDQARRLDFDATAMEKVARLLELLDAISAIPLLRDHLALNRPLKKSSARAARTQARVEPRRSLDESTDSPAFPRGPTRTRARTSQTEHFFNSL